jgi:exonuclease III
MPPTPVTHSVISASDDEPAKDAVTIASLNIAGQPQIADRLVAWTHERAVDILLLQEVGHLSIDGAVFVAALSERLGFHFAYAPADLVGDIHTQGLAIMSRYPLDEVCVHPLAYHHLRFKSRYRIALSPIAVRLDSLAYWSGDSCPSLGER